MTRVAIALAVLVAAGCHARAGAPSASTSPGRDVSVDSGSVVIAPSSPMLSRLQLQPVVARNLPTDELVAPGKIEVNPNRVSKIVLPVTGRVTNVLVKVGDAVRRDQPLLTIQSPDADGALSAFVSASATVTQADAELRKAQADFDRASDLFEHNAVAQKDVLTASSALAQAKAASAEAFAARNQALRRLQVLGLQPSDSMPQVTVRSPLAGKVLDLSVVPGEFRTDPTANVMTIADLSTVWVTSQVPESYIRFVQVGERVEINLVAYPNETFEGRVSRIADTVDPQSRTVKVQAEMDNRRGRFRPEMFGSIHHVESVKPIPVVPPGALIQDGERTVVFVERGAGRFEEREVEIGRRAGTVVRVVKGLTPGERVVVDGGMLLKGLVSAT